MTPKELGRALAEFDPEDDDHWEEINSVLKRHYDEQEIIEEIWNVYKTRIEE